MYTKDQLYAYARKRRLRDTDIGTSAIYRDLNGLGYLAPEHAVGTVPGYVFDDDSRTILSRVRGSESAGVTRVAPRELSFLASKGTEQDQIEYGTSANRTNSTKSQSRLQLTPGHVSVATRSMQPSGTSNAVSRTARFDLDESGAVEFGTTDDIRRLNATGEQRVGQRRFPTRLRMSSAGIEFGTTRQFDANNDTLDTTRFKFSDGTVGVEGFLANRYYGATFYGASWSFSHQSQDALVASGGDPGRYQYRYRFTMNHPGHSRWFPMAQLLPTSDGARRVIQTLSCYATEVGPTVYVVQGIYESAPRVVVGTGVALSYTLRILFVRSDLWE